MYVVEARLELTFSSNSQESSLLNSANAEITGLANLIDFNKRMKD